MNRTDGVSRHTRVLAGLVLTVLALGGTFAAADGGAVAAIVPKERLTLWNGRNITGWTTFLGDRSVAPENVWSATEGVLRLDTKASGYLRTENSFSNYRLHVAWRWPKDAAPNSNSGVMVHLHGPDVIWPSSFVMEGFPIEFREVWLEPLADKTPKP
jgi:hypothetical protein